MQKKKATDVWGIITETVSAVAICLFVILQIYYDRLYQISMQQKVMRLLPVVLLYAGMCLLQHEPEILNGFHSEPLTGKVRFYAVRMVRISKMIVCLGFLIPSFFDILGKPVGEIFSVGMIVCVILVIVWHIFQIYRYNSGENHKNS